MKEAFRTLTAAGWALAAICLLLMIVLIWWSATAGGRERARQERAVQAANAQARATDAAARDRAADQRLTDLKINTRLEKEPSAHAPVSAWWTLSNLHCWRPLSLSKDALRAVLTALLSRGSRMQPRQSDLGLFRP
jgi:hypothetical protein